MFLLSMLCDMMPFLYNGGLLRECFDVTKWIWDGVGEGEGEEVCGMCSTVIIIEC